MNVYLVKPVLKDIKKEDLTLSDLRGISKEFIALSGESQNKYSLGAGLYKIRAATKSGRGKSGGSRVVIAFQKDEKLFWIHLFSKNEKANISKKELKRLKDLATILFKYTEDEIDYLIGHGQIKELKNV